MGSRNHGANPATIQLGTIRIEEISTLKLKLSATRVLLLNKTQPHLQACLQRQVLKNVPNKEGRFRMRGNVPVSASSTIPPSISCIATRTLACSGSKARRHLWRHNWWLFCWVWSSGRDKVALCLNERDLGIVPGEFVCRGGKACWWAGCFMVGNQEYVDFELDRVL